MRVANTTKATIKEQSKDAREFAELLADLSDSDKEKIKCIMIGLQMAETARATPMVK